LPSTGTATTRFFSRSGKTAILLSTLHHAHPKNSLGLVIALPSQNSSGTSGAAIKLCGIQDPQKTVELLPVATCSAQAVHLQRIRQTATVVWQPSHDAWGQSFATWSQNIPQLLGGLQHGCYDASCSPFRCLTGCGQQWLTGSHPGRSR
jgi:hypothetical protein